MPTLEGGLFRQWREAYGLSRQDIMDARRPKGKASVGTLKNHEKNESSMSIETLLTYIRALETAVSKDAHITFRIGDTSADKLIAFFAGPDRFDSDRVRPTAVRASGSRRGGVPA